MNPVKVQKNFFKYIYNINFVITFQSICYQLTTNNYLLIINSLSKDNQLPIINNSKCHLSITILPS